MIKNFEINSSGLNVRCRVYSEKGAEVRKAVIFGHGFGGHKDNKAAERYADHVLKKHKDAAVITFNWPCHGDDVKKKLTLSDCSSYLSLVIRDTEEKYPGAELYGYATSFGGYLFLRYIHECGAPFVKTALRCPAVNMYGVMMNTIMTGDDSEKLRKGKDAAVGFDRKISVSPAFLEELRENDIRKYDYLDFAESILILHGTKDEVVPITDSKEFADNNLIEFIPVQNADHRFQDPKMMDEAIRHIQTFFDW